MNSVSDAGVRAAEWRTGWPGLLGATGAVSTGAGLFVYTASYFVKPMEAALGWSRGQIALGSTLALVTSALALPVAGALADRFGNKLIGFICILGYGLLCLAMSAIPPQLAFYYATLVAIAFIYTGTTPVTFGPLLAAQFVKSRGTALGLMGSGVAAVLVPMAPVMIFLTNTVSWRAGYALLGGLALCIGLPCLFLAMRGRGWRTVTSQAVRDREAGLTLRQAMGRGAYWKIAVGIYASTMAIGGFLSQMSAIISDKGMSIAELGAVASCFVVAVALTRPTVGVLLDVVSPPLVGLISMFLAALGCVILLLTPDPSVAVCMLSVALVGLAMGGEGDLQAFFTARYFGLRKYATIYGTLASCTSVGFGSGAAVFGLCYDHYKNYDVALIVAGSAFTLAGLAFLSLIWSQISAGATRSEAVAAAVT